MNQVRYASISNRFSRKSYSKVTAAESNNKYQMTDDGFQQLVRSDTFRTHFPIQPGKYLKVMRKNMFLFPQFNTHFSTSNAKNNDQNSPSLIQPQIWKFTQLIQKRFSLNSQTTCLGLCYYLKLLLIQTKNQRNQIYLKKFHISVCIYLAAKVIEQQKNIPKPAAYQYFCGQNYTFEDYNQFQRQLTQILQFDLQKATIITFLNFYLSMGIFYLNQIFESNQQIQELQKQIITQGMQSIKQANFLGIQDGNPETEAIKIVRQIRRKYYLTEQNRNLQLLWQPQRPSLNRGQGLSCLKLTRSMGRIHGLGRGSSSCTHMVAVQRKFQQVKGDFTQDPVLLVRKGNKRALIGKSHTLCGQLIKRKPNNQKSYKRKGRFHQQTNFPDQTQLKYLALKGNKSQKQTQQQLLNRQLTRSKSLSSTIGSLVNVSIKYQRNQNKDLKRDIGQIQCKDSSYVACLQVKQMLLGCRMNDCSSLCQKICRIQGVGVNGRGKLEIFDEVNRNENQTIAQQDTRKPRQSQQRKQLNKDNKYFHRKNCGNNHSKATQITSAS